jgi:ribosome-associated translation inhibitor RaiA
LQLDIRFRGVPPSESLEARIRERAEQLARLEAGLIHCRVLVEQRHKHHHKGGLYHVRVHLSWGGGDAIVDREPHADHAHEDAYVAVRDAFDAARRRLEDRQRRIRGEAKVHTPQPSGLIVQLDADGGVIETREGGVLPFTRDRVEQARFEDLGIGDPVRFEMADDQIVSVLPLVQV